jgi:acyl-CoA synthetase (AMP-forming)/AMP-acid ligase II
MNIASYLPENARKIPFQRAVVFPQGRDSQGRVSYTHLTFRQLNEEADRYAHGFTGLGIKKGTKVLLMVRPSLEFIALTFALFKMGAVPVLIDPGMGTANLLNCIASVEPEALVAIPLVHAARLLSRLLYRKYFRSVRYSVTIGPKRFCFLSGGPTIHEIRCPDAGPFEVVETRDTDMAAILFTTGSTGSPKGVVYLHAMFDAQVRLIQQHYSIREGEIDLPGFPLFALFSTAMGMTCVIPDMDPTKPAQVDPVKIVEAIENHGVTNSFGSPAIWNRVTDYCIREGIQLPSLKRILMAGAPVSGTILDRFTKILAEDADTYTPYGATESLPLCSISGREILQETEAGSREGAGTCVGLPLPGIRVKIIEIRDEAIPTWDGVRELSRGQIGEIAVCGPVITHEYYNRKEATALAKIRDGGKIWHRMGDVGYLDEQGRLWFCGRMAHRVITSKGPLFTVPCEAIFNQHPDVFRTALVGIGKKPDQQPVIIVEPKKGKKPQGKADVKRFIAELLKLGQRNPLTREIKIFLFHSAFPVDIRHNVKIFREKLAVWAETEVLKGP